MKSRFKVLIRNRISSKTEIVDFNKSDWAEIYYAIESKIMAMQNGDYNDSPHHNGNEEWIKQLCDIHKVLGEKLIKVFGAMW